jgi:hypothetical protein
VKIAISNVLHREANVIGGDLLARISPFAEPPICVPASGAISTPEHDLVLIAEITSEQVACLKVGIRVN